MEHFKMRPLNAKMMDVTIHESKVSRGGKSESFVDSKDEIIN